MEKGRRTIQLAANPVRVLTAAKGVASSGGDEVRVVIGLGERFDDAEFFALTVPDAERLRVLLERALEESLPRHHM